MTTSSIAYIVSSAVVALATSVSAASASAQSCAESPAVRKGAWILDVSYRSETTAAHGLDYVITRVEHMADGGHAVEAAEQLTHAVDLDDACGMPSDARRTPAEPERVTNHMIRLRTPCLCVWGTCLPSWTPSRSTRCTTGAIPWAVGSDLVWRSMRRNAFTHLLSAGRIPMKRGCRHQVGLMAPTPRRFWAHSSGGWE
jgi:hypothetical protein